MLKALRRHPLLASTVEVSPARYVAIVLVVLLLAGAAGEGRALKQHG